MYSNSGHGVWAQRLPTGGQGGQDADRAGDRRRSGCEWIAWEFGAGGWTDGLPNSPGAHFKCVWPPRFQQPHHRLPYSSLPFPRSRPPANPQAEADTSVSLRVRPVDGGYLGKGTVSLLTAHACKSMVQARGELQLGPIMKQRCSTSCIFTWYPLAGSTELCEVQARGQLRLWPITKWIYIFLIFTYFLFRAAWSATRCRPAACGTWGRILESRSVTLVCIRFLPSSRQHRALRGSGPRRAAAGCAD